MVISTCNNIHLISCRDKNDGWESCCCIIYGKFDSTKTAHVIPTRFATEEEKQILFDAIKSNGYHWNEKTKTLEKLIEPKFKAGDKIQWKEDIREKRIIDNVFNDFYTVQGFGVILFTAQDEWELVPNKFDINTLKPFDKVLVRADNKHVWSIQFFERMNNILKDSFVCMGGVRYYQCIPYKGNEHLLNTTNDCDDFYKTWK